ncbi:MAG: response regulator [Halobacteriovoraceae bacterium]|nr:response regulator [Halobacteriovoraceae bacterium]
MDEKKLFKIIVVDDSDFSRKQIINILEKNGFNVVANFGNAPETIQYLVAHDIDLAIVDVVMPKISGFDLVNQITENFRNIHVIMVSSLSQERIILESIASGAQDFIQKPIKEELLVASIQKIMNDFTED